MIRVPSPSKLNLFLHITGRRPDGYHELQSIFQLIDLCDWLEFEQTADKQIQIEVYLWLVPVSAFVSQCLHYYSHLTRIAG